LEHNSLGAICCFSHDRYKEDDVEQIDETVANDVRVLMGHNFVLYRQLGRAAEEFRKAGTLWHLTLVGDAYIQQNLLQQAKACYDEAGQEIPQGTLVAVGQRYLRLAVDEPQYELGWLNTASEAFQLAKNAVGLTAVGDAHGVKGRLEQLRNNYTLANVNVPPAILVQCGNACFDAGDLNAAFEAFSEAHDTEGMLRVGARHLERGSVQTAQHVYLAAGVEIPKDKLLELGKAKLESGLIEQARMYYEAAGEKLAEDQLLELGDTALKHDELERAARYYTAAGDKHGFNLIGDKYLEALALEKALDSYMRGSSVGGLLKVGECALVRNPLESALQLAERAYSAANTPIPTAELLAFVERCFRECNPDKFDAYEEARKALTLFVSRDQVVHE